MKKVIAACIDRVFEFDTTDEAKGYLNGLKSSGKRFRVLWDEATDNGGRKIRVQEQYNKSPMIEE